MVMWLCGWKPLMVSHHLTIYGGHWSSGNGDITYLICRLFSQDHVIENSNDWMGAPHLLSPPWQSLVVSHFGSRGMFLVCRVIWQDHVVKGYFRFQEKRPLCSKRASWFNNPSWPDSLRLMGVKGLVAVRLKRLYSCAHLLWLYCSFTVSFLLWW